MSETILRGPTVEPAPRGASTAFRDKARAAACRSCCRRGLDPILDLGAMPLSDGFLDATQLEAPPPSYPLELAFCPGCSLVQILETVPAETLFCDDYSYFSSYSDSWLAHSRESARSLISERGLGPDSLVIELASNDGYMLRNFVAAGIPVLGIDPADGPAGVAEGLGIPTLCTFFDRELAEELRATDRRADVLLANNVLAHVPDTNGFVAGIARVLAPGGLAVIEVPYVVDLIAKRAFDTIYHEHLCYFSVTALDRLFARHGLHLNRVERLRSHGGSLRLFLELQPAPRPEVERLLREEAERGTGELEHYAGFADAVAALRIELLELLGRLKGEGKRIAAYGAAAKGTILLNAFGLGVDTIEYAVDRNVHKHGKYVPGARIPICPPERILEDRPDVLLLLPWNLREEVLAQQHEFRSGGGRFVIPLPSPEVV